MASACGLPCSLVSRRLSSSTLPPSTPAMASRASRRLAIGVARQAGKAARAAATAWSSCSREQSGAWPITCSLAGFNTSNRPAPATPLPPMVMV